MPAGEPQQGSIKRLGDDVVARIAAGEVLQRPASALKELLDNSIDAGATQISVTAADGGIKLLQVQDNGCGVQATDLPLLCARHATSKLRMFEEMRDVSTLGFRGEALASISFAAHVTVTTMAAGQAHGTRAIYRDGELLETCLCAATAGTTILVEDMFYTLPARQKAMSAGGNEYSRLLHVVGQYATFNSNFSLSIRRQGRPPDLQTVAGALPLDVISKVYAATLAASLRSLQCSSGCDSWLGEGTSVPHDTPAFTAQGYISSHSNTWRSGLLLRVNRRLVQCSPLKRAIEAVYATAAPGCKPFVILDMQLPNTHIDANLHPTKEEVAILHQEVVIDSVCSAIEHVLRKQLPGNRLKPAVTQSRAQHAGGATRVRTDHASQTLQTFAHAHGTPSQNSSVKTLQGGGNGSTGVPVVQTAILAGAHQGLAGVLKQHTLVGVVAGNCVLQHEAQLYLFRVQAIVEDLVYQQAVLRHGALPRIQLDAALDLVSLLQVAWGDGQLPASSQLGQEAPGSPVAHAAQMLVEHAALLSDEFAIEISPDAELRAVPDVLDGALPDLLRLPAFVLELSEALLNDETQHLSSIAQVLSRLYIAEQNRDAIQGLMQLARRCWLPSRDRATDGSIACLTSLGQLYKIFERC